MDTTAHCLNGPERAPLSGAKIGRNCANDHKALTTLLAEGWRVGIVWECALRGANKNIEGVAKSLADWLGGDAPTTELRG